MGEEELLAEVAGRGGGAAGRGRARTRGERDAGEGEESEAAADAGYRTEEAASSRGCGRPNRRIRLETWSGRWAGLLPFGPFYLSKPAFQSI